MTTTLPGNPIAAPVGARGADTLQTLTEANVKTLVQNGYTFCIRYVPLSNNREELTAEEAQTILEGGLALMVVQRGRSGSVTASQGTDDGAAAVKSCQDIGLPAGVNIWLDLEEVNGDVFNYANSWYTEVLSAKYVPGVYIGSDITWNDQPVTSYQLYHDLKFQHYWRSMSDVPNVDQRGYQMLQLYSNQAEGSLTLPGGLEIDVDVTQDDRKGNQVQWLSPAAAPIQEAVTARGRSPRTRT